MKLRNVKHWFTIVALAVAVTSATPHAWAAPPSRGCPVPFTLHDIADFGPGFTAFLEESIDKNDDSLVCAMPIPDAVPFPPINFVDNVAASG